MWNQRRKYNLRANIINLSEPDENTKSSFQINPIEQSGKDADTQFVLFPSAF